MERTELARILRTARTRLSPQDVGLPAGPRRRVAGLRREEVAQLAGVSVEYVVRLEQGRSSQPSDAVLEAICRALRLGGDERELVYRLAGSTPPLADRIDLALRPSVTRLLERFTDLPAMVTSAKGDVLAQNPLARELIGDLEHPAQGPANIPWQRFLGGADARVAVTAEEDEETAQQHVTQLCAALSRYPADPDLRQLLDELLEGSEQFWSIWDSGPFTTRSGHAKTIAHPELGTFLLDCDTLLLPEADQSMIVFSAETGTDGADALERLRAIVA